MTRQLSFGDYRLDRGHGGPRTGAGRPRKEPGLLQHAARERIRSGSPVHVTLRVRPDVPGLRSQRMVRELRKTLAKGCERGDFRVVHYALQTNHLHLIVEAQGKDALARGMKSIGARFARAVNRVFLRKGPVLLERFHAHVLRTPKEVRHALAYVLLNVRKHFRERRGTPPPVRLDEASSGRWFDGWKHPPPASSTRGPGLREVAPARFWLTRELWRSYGLIDPAEVPGAA